MKLSRERQEDKYLTYSVPEFNVGDKVLENIQEIIGSER